MDARLAGNAVDDVLEADAREEAFDAIAERRPQLVREAAALADASARAVAEAARHARAFLDRHHDLGYEDLGRWPAELVSAVPAAHALDQSGAPLLEEQLLEIVEGDLLALCDGRQRHGAAVTVLCKIGHGHHRI